VDCKSQQTTAGAFVPWFVQHHTNSVVGFCTARFTSIHTFRSHVPGMHMPQH